MKDIINDETVRANARLGLVLLIACGWFAAVAAFAPYVFVAFGVGGMLAALVCGLPGPKAIQLARARTEAERLLAGAPLAPVTPIAGNETKAVNE